MERRLARPFEKVQEQLVEMIGRPWEDVEVSISTSADKKNRSEADVICDLIAKADVKLTVTQQVRRSVVRWIGKPWRERQNPWDKYKDRVPPRPPSTTGEGEEWKPFRPDDQ